MGGVGDIATVAEEEFNRTDGKKQLVAHILKLLRLGEGGVTS
jgi:hypothetical protein